MPSSSSFLQSILTSLAAWVVVYGLSLFMPSAGAAAPVGIHTVSRVNAAGAPIDRYTGLSDDGLIVFGQFPNQVWTYPTGTGPLALPGATPMSQIWDSSPDRSILLGMMRNVPGTIVATRGGEVLWTLPPPTVTSTAGAAWVSPNGEFVAGGAGIMTSSGPTAFDTARWSRTGGFELLDRTGYVAADTVAVTDDGTVYGHGYRARFTQPWENPVSGYYRDEAVRWMPSGQLERLAGLDASGQPWRVRLIQDISPDGSVMLGWSGLTIETDTGPDEIEIHGVFGTSGLIWSFWDERTDDRSDSPVTAGMSSDGALVFGNMWQVPFLPRRESEIWTEDGRNMTFTVFLRSMGIDPSGFQIGDIIDVSGDGRSFLVYGSEIGGDGYQLLVVVPEPGTAPLIMLGVLALSGGAARTSRPARG